jgi:hypothetical protein
MTNLVNIPQSTNCQPSTSHTTQMEKQTTDPYKDIDASPFRFNTESGYWVKGNATILSNGHCCAHVDVVAHNFRRVDTTPELEAHLKPAIEAHMCKYTFPSRIIVKTETYF